MGKNTTSTNQNWIQSFENSTQLLESSSLFYETEPKSSISGVSMCTDMSERLVSGDSNRLYTREYGHARSNKHNRTSEAVKSNPYPIRKTLSTTLNTTKTAKTEQSKSQSLAQWKCSVDLKSTTRSKADTRSKTADLSPSINNTLLEEVFSSSKKRTAEDSLSSLLLLSAVDTKSIRRRGHRRASIVFAGGVGNHVEILTVPSPALKVQNL